ncbi:hypothetical protein BOTCAL_0393g00090 [Botryotinia calthae]|uniref:Uncharacterized protein n=1 Tax=Botryotinia calthae TaxID=38488 RepID=A0A4Y8CQN9_9HELO|nr:hypothetical protein BOTCAL_0393g00090 [Botryotinia calthae]
MGEMLRLYIGIYIELYATIASASARRSINGRGCMENLPGKRNSRDGEGKEEDISSRYGIPPRRNGDNRPKELLTARKRFWEKQDR